MRNYEKTRILLLGFIAVVTILFVAVPAFSQPQEITNSIGMRFRLIPAGSFMMGAVPGDSEAQDDEKPQHRVEITKDVYIGVHEVTQAQYEAVMGKNPSYLKGSDRPVEMIMWEEANEFCRKLSEMEGVSYRLPTEAEWEYAARAGSTTRYYWGDSSAESVMKRYSWYEKNAQASKWTSPHADEEGTQPVGLKMPNGWGLYDMSGNVCEWCADWYGKNYYRDSPLSDPAGPSSGVGRVFRGGSWSNGAGDGRSAFRYRHAPGGYYGNLGFRIVRDVD